MTYLPTPSENDFLSKNKSLKDYKQRIHSRNKKIHIDDEKSNKYFEPNNFKYFNLDLVDTTKVDFTLGDIDQYDKSFMDTLHQTSGIISQVLRIKRLTNTKSFEFSLTVRHYADLSRIENLKSHTNETVSQYHGSLLFTGISIDKSRTTREKIPLDIHIVIHRVNDVVLNGHGTHLEFSYTYDDNYVYLWLTNFKPHDIFLKGSSNHYDTISSVTQPENKRDNHLIRMNQVNELDRVPFVHTTVKMVLKDTSLDIEDIDAIKILDYSDTNTHISTIDTSRKQSLEISSSYNETISLYNIGLSSERGFTTRTQPIVITQHQLEKVDGLFKINTISSIKDSLISLIKSNTNQSNTIIFDIETIIKPIWFDPDSRSFDKYGDDDSVAHLIISKEIGSYDKISDVFTVSSMITENVYSEEGINPITTLRRVYNFVKKNASPSLFLKTGNSIPLHENTNEILSKVPEFGNTYGERIFFKGETTPVILKALYFSHSNGYNTIFVIGKNGYVARFDFTTMSFIPFASAVGSDNVTAIEKISDNVIVVASIDGNVGSYEFNDSNNTWNIYYHNDTIVPTNGVIGTSLFDGDTIHAIGYLFVDPNNEVYVVGDKGKFRKAIIGNEFDSLVVCLPNYNTENFVDYDDIILGYSTDNLFVVATHDGKVSSYDGTNWFDYDGETGLVYKEENNQIKLNPIILEYIFKPLTDLPDFRFHSRIIYANNIPYIFGGYDGRANYNSMYYFDFEKNTWQPETIHPTYSLRAFGMSHYNGKIYIATGHYGTTYTNSLYIYDLTTKVWSEGSAYPGGNGDGGDMVEYGGKLYFTGGYVSGSWRNWLYEYNIDTNVWTQKNSFIVPRVYHTSVAHNGKIYVIGGLTVNNNPTNSFEIYDISLNEWTAGPNIPVSNSGSSNAIILNNKIYVKIEGAGNEKVLYVYDIINDYWFIVNNKKENAFNSPFMLYNKDIYSVGGRKNSGDTSTSFTLNSKRMIANDFESINRSYGDAIMYNDDIYLFGGRNHDYIKQYNYSINLKTRKKQKIEFMNIQRSDFASVYHNGKIYVYGGFSNRDGGVVKITNTFEVYDISLNSWTLLSSPSLAKGYAYSTLSVVNNIIYLIGGSLLESLTDIEETTLFIKYDISLDTWTSLDLAPLTISMSGATSIVYNDLIYIFYKNKILYYNQSDNTWSILDDQDFSIRFSKGILYNDIVYFTGGNVNNESNQLTFSKNIITYSIIEDKWNILENSPIYLSNTTPIIYNDLLYTFNSGMSEDIYTENNLIYIYNITSNKWYNNNDFPYYGQINFLKNSFYINGDISYKLNLADNNITMPHRYAYALTYWDNNIYIMGGRGKEYNSLPLNDMWAYNIITNKWSRKKNFSLPRSGNVAEAIDGKIYMTFGRNGNIPEYYNDMQIYDIANNNWYSGASYSHGRSRSGSLVYDNKIYIFGGHSFLDLNDVLIYNPSTNEWDNVAPFNVNRHIPAVAAVDKKIYLMGGDGGGALLDDVQMYNPNTNSWSYKASMPKSLHYAHATVYDNKIYIFGGRSSANLSLNEVQIYNVSTGLWDFYRNTMPFVMAYHMGVTINDKYYIVSGELTDVASRVKMYYFDFEKESFETYFETYKVDNMLKYYDFKTQKFLSLSNDINESRLFNTSIRINNNIYYSGGINRNDSEYQSAVNNFDVYDLKIKKWLNLKDMPIKIYKHSLVYYNDKIYLFGGILEHQKINNYVYSYSIIDDEWTKELLVLDILSKDYSYVQDDKYNNLIYIIGGLVNNKPINKIYKIDLLLNIYIELNIRLPRNMANTHSIIYNDDLYILGGMGEKKINYSNELYKCNINDFRKTNHELITEIRKFPDYEMARTNSAATICKNNIYLFAGKTEGLTFENDVQRYDPELNKWYRVKPFPIRRFSFSLASTEEGIYIFGGDDHNYSNTVHFYNPNLDTWTLKTPFKQESRAHQTIYLNDKIYLFGGQDASNMLSRMEIYDIKSDTWAPGLEMPSARGFHNALIYKNQILSIGGYSTPTLSHSDIFIYNPESVSWSILTQIPDNIQKSSCGIIDNKLYLFDGFDGTNRSNLIYTYDFASDEWKVFGQDNKDSRTSYMHVVYDNKLFVFAGNNGSTSLDDTQIVDPSLQISRNRIDHNIILYNNKIYNIGGVQKEDLSYWRINYFEIYDIDKIKWTKKRLDNTIFNGGLYGNSISVDEDIAYISSGVVNNGLSNKLYSYNLLTDNISEISSFDSYNRVINHTSFILNSALYLVGGRHTFRLPVSIWSHKAVIIGSKIYILGGSRRIYNIDFEYDNESLFVYDISNNTWDTEPNMPYPDSIMFIAEAIGTKIYVAGGLTGKIRLSSLYIYDTISKTWSEGPNMPNGPRSEMASGVIGNNLYIFGGRVNDEIALNDTQIYNILTNTWSIGPTLNVNRRLHSSVSHNDKIYAIGGHNGNFLSSIEVFDETSGVWTLLNPFTTGRQELAVSAYNNKIYLFGGYSGVYLNDIQVYDISLNSWTTLNTTLKYEKNRSHAIKYNSKIYIIGGFSPSIKSDTELYIYEPDIDSFLEENVFNQVIKYDFNTSTWSSVSPLNTPRYGHKTINYNGLIMTIGGNDGINDLNTVEIFDELAETWSLSSDTLNTARSLFGCEIFNEKIYISGGKSGITKLNTIEEYDDVNKWVLRTETLNLPRMGLNSIAIDNERIFYIGGEGETPTSIYYYNSLEIYTKYNNQLVIKSLNNKFINARSYAKAIYLNDKIYICGGYNGNELNDMQIYDLKTKHWSYGPNLNNGRFRHIFVTDGSKLYAIGGHNGTNYLTSVEIYDPVTNEWSLGENMIAPLDSLSGVYHNDYIYIVCGNNDIGISRETYRYNISTDSWETMAQAPSSLHYGVANLYNDKIYLFSGQDASNNILRELSVYDITNNVWSKISTETPDFGIYMSSVIKDGKIYYFAGNNDIGIKNSLTIYDIEKMSWTIGPNLPIYTNATTSVLVGNKIYILGGYISNSITSYFNEGIRDEIIVYDIDNNEFYFDYNISNKIERSKFIQNTNSIFEKIELERLSKNYYYNKLFIENDQMYINRNNDFEIISLSSLSTPTSINKYNNSLIITTSIGKLVSVDLTNYTWRLENGIGQFIAPNYYYQDLQYKSLTHAHIVDDILILTNEDDDIFSIDLLTNEIKEQTGYGGENEDLIYSMDRTKLLSSDNSSFIASYKIQVGTDTLIIFLTNTKDVISYNMTTRQWSTVEGQVKEFISQMKLTIYPSMVLSNDSKQLVKTGIH